MREHLFKAKRIDNGEWEYGNLKSIHKGGANYETAYYILNCYGETRNGLARDAVDPETVCEFTGLLDKNGKKIFEHDLLRCAIENCCTGKVERFFECEVTYCKTMNAMGWYGKDERADDEGCHRCYSTR